MNQIELVHLRDELKTLEGCADVCQRMIDRIINQYGTGVRPSWVSAEVSIEKAQRDSYMRRAEEVRKKISEITGQPS